MNDPSPVPATANTLGHQLPLEIERCQELLAVYESLPRGVGAFGAAMIRQHLAAAIQANNDQDAVAMLKAYQTLKGCQ